MPESAAGLPHHVLLVSKKSAAKYVRLPRRGGENVTLSATPKARAFDSVWRVRLILKTSRYCCRGSSASTTDIYQCCNVCCSHGVVQCVVLCVLHCVLQCVLQGVLQCVLQCALQCLLQCVLQCGTV